MKDVLNIIGKFWQGVEGVPQLVKSIMVLQAQIDQERTELVNSTSRHKIDVFRKKFWLPLDVETDDDIPKFDSGDFFDSLGTFDMSRPTRRMTLPKYFVSAEFVSDGIEVYTFRNPIEGRTFEVPEGVQTVWLHNAMVDQDDLYTQFGYTLGLKLPSSERYKILINALMDSLVNGPSQGALMMGLSAITGLPVIREKKERVLLIDNNKVITDAHEYECKGEILLEEGNVYQKGTPVTDDILLNNDLNGLELGMGMTGLCEPFTVLNQECPIAVSEEEGYTRVDIDTIPKEINDIIHQNGIDAARQVTEPCELLKIQQALQLNDIVIEPEPEPATVTKPGGGLGQYMVFHRFG